MLLSFLQPLFFHFFKQPVMNKRPCSMSIQRAASYFHLYRTHWNSCFTNMDHYVIHQKKKKKEDGIAALILHSIHFLDDGLKSSAHYFFPQTSQEIQSPTNKSDDISVSQIYYYLPTCQPMMNLQYRKAKVCPRSFRNSLT